MTAASSRATTQEVRVRRSHLLVATGVLVLCAVAYVVLAAVLAGDLPERVATHFGADGVADGWMSRGAALIVGGLVCVGVPLVLLVVAAVGQWWRGRSARAVTAFVGALGVWLLALFAQLFASQRGLPDPTSARLDPMALLWALGAALVVGAGLALVLPRALPQPEPLTPEAMEIGPTDAVSWFGRAHLSHEVLLLVLGTLGLLSVVTAAVGDPWLWLVV
ncbi:DUF1648 domain-containing protein [Ornithinimicrobium avium]|uniref:DUF1648 domain-containing protein n=1 Tax=Ornithinimicrobium avium TaxID=2283195 RepID=A0A345NQY3_9MICO|nr:DUF1648 domain-containing protein [Ornithinimicrobium avium]AXH97441.1 DUF1648 domain-containing protein [Ornithinimicrobium avium]